MANKTDKTTLGYLGEDFQYKLIHCFMENREFFKDLYEIIDQNSFTNPHLKTFVGVMKEEFEKHESVPSYDTMGILLREKATTPTDVEIMLGELDTLRNMPSDGAEVVEELGTKFFKQQYIVKTANQILKIASNGVDEDKCTKYVELMTDALNKGSHSDWGSNLTDNLDETLSPDFRHPIPTGIGFLDEILEGGLGLGELGVIAGPTSFGKTTLTTALASHAALNGHKVVQIVFEDQIKQIRRKHLARFVTLYNDKGINVEAKDLSKPEFIELVKDTLNNHPKEVANLNNNLKIFRCPSGEMTAVMIERKIKKLISIGFKPELCIVDYFECINHDCFTNTSNDFDKEGKSMRKFEALAGKLNMALWIPTQGTKDSISAELVTMDKMGGSAKKAQIAHIIISIARTTEDIEKNRATVAVLKNRAGKSGKVIENVNFNNGTCVINTDGCGDDVFCDSVSGFQQSRSETILKSIFDEVAAKKK
jgi:replicative DNA helicase